MRNTLNIDTITTYPLKSAGGMALEECQVLPYGLQYDRNWAVFDKNLKVITAREFPQLLGISVMIERENLMIIHDSRPVLNIAADTGKVFHNLQVFGENASGYDTGKVARDFFSDYLGTDCFLMYMGNNHARHVSPKYGGKPQDVVTYADECPVLLISEASLRDLNGRLEEPVTMHHFRPNLTVAGCQPYEEDNWKKIRIGDCEFEVSQQCQRCVLTTIDPVSQQKSPQQEPLRTLATYRKHPGDGVAFGVHLIPRKTGKISTGDKVLIIS